MKVLTAKLEHAFRKAAQISEHLGVYGLRGAGAVPVCDKELHWAVQDYYDLKVEVHRTIRGGNDVRALVLRRPKGHPKPTVVVISTDQPETWVRFAKAKELSQIIIDEQEDWSIDGAGTLKSYFYQTRIVVDDTTPPLSVQSEEIAMYAAIEILYPFADRKRDLENGAGKPSGYAKLSQDYDLPPNIVGRALFPDYMTLAERIWASVNK
jgi:hypothetical protein